MSPSLSKELAGNIRTPEGNSAGLGSLPHYTFRRVRMIVSSLRLVPHILIMLNTDRYGLLRADITCWAKAWHLEKPAASGRVRVVLVAFMTLAPEFSNILYMPSRLKGKLFSWMCPPRESLEITPGNIGPGLFIQHGSGTLISAHSIGANCWINQQVTIGYSNQTDRPVIGNNVKIFAGAKIIGKVKIGDNATIGANTVVIRDVAPGATILGVPGKVIWQSN